ncbi:metallophosphoesterase [Anderseniella sp. Alg231-50]|uniref:metallophosphoesterase n=1 Tax=Anderseniella sp. Alg231-50 TaxID=1922226 RepID=UPI000D550F99
MLITQISDCHIAWPQPDGTDRLRDLERCVDFVNGLDPQPDLVVHTGDIAHDGARVEYEKAAEKLKELRAELCVIPGNRDDRSKLREVFADRLPANCHPEFVQYLVSTDELCVLMLDTMSTQSNKARLCRARMDHLKGMLEQANGRPVVIFMHHPPFEIAVAPVPFQFEDRANLAEFAELLSRHSDVRRIYCGHSHRAADGQIAGIAASTISCTAKDLRVGQPGHLEESWQTYRLAF